MKTNLHKYWLWIVILTASICWGTSCSDTELHTGQQLLFPARDNGLWGYIDQTGKMVIEPEYIAAEPFGNGLAPVCVEENHVRKWGYVDEKGNRVIEPQYEHAKPFSEGLAAVCQDDLWGFIDFSGNWVIKPQYKEVGSFHWGRAWFYCYKAGSYNTQFGETFHTKLFGFLDRKGNVVIEPQFDMVHDFYEGLCEARLGSCPLGKRGYIDTLGNWSIHAVANAAGDFRNGIAPMNINNTFFYINHEGEILNATTPHIRIDEQFAHLRVDVKRSIAEDMEVSMNDKIERTSNDLTLDSVSYRNLFAQYFKNDLKSFRNERGLFGFKDPQRNVVIEPQFFEAEPFCNGLSRVVFKGWKMGYIDMTGKVIYKEK